MEKTMNIPELMMKFHEIPRSTCRRANENILKHVAFPVSCRPCRGVHHPRWENVTSELSSRAECGSSGTDHRWRPGRSCGNFVGVKRGAAPVDTKMSTIA